MTYSIIIPTLNEEQFIGRLLSRLEEILRSVDHEVIIVDAESKDQTLAIANTYDVIILSSPKRSRAHQMNIGAQKAKGNILYFLHADVLPCTNCITLINQVIQEGKFSGCFSYQFDSPRCLLKINAWFTRFESNICGGGDQTLFIKKQLFQEMGGFNEAYIIMEDFELTQRLRQQNAFAIIPHDVIISARKYENNSYIRVQLANLFVFSLFKMNVAPRTLAWFYSWLLR